MGASFLIESTFSITKKGFVIAGQIQSGTVKIGDELVLPIKKRTIVGIEMGHGKNVDENYSFVALLLGDLSENEINDIKENVQNGSTLQVFNT